MRNFFIIILVCLTMFIGGFVTAHGVMAKPTTKSALTVISTPMPTTPIPTRVPTPTPKPIKKIVGKKTVLISSVIIKLRKEPGTYNAGVAAKIVNGYVLKSGSIFSYNKVVGERTKERGFIEGTLPITVDGKEVIIKSVGSGVCRLSVGLATAAKRANMRQIEITPHEYTPYYLKTNKDLVDATVYWGYIDNKFQNNKNFDIQIKCSVDSKSTLRVSFYKLIYQYK